MTIYWEEERLKNEKKGMDESVEFRGFLMSN